MIGNNIAMYGMTLGLIVGLIIAIVIIKYANKNNKFKTEYDERQKIERGKGYTIAFYTLVAYESLMSLLSIGDIELPLHDFAIHFTGIVIAITVHCVYCIWKEVYWGLNNDRKKYMMVFALCIVLNALPVLGNALAGNLFDNGKIGLAMLNIMVLIMLVIVVITMLIKGMVNKNTGTDEE
ncbi:MAG: hypothetical protein K6E68_05905 [Lachnospiraceae bacterium]|nr:hypothetical protein [Lachnospiraceae bacterium]